MVPLYLVIGAPAVGKSTTCQALAQRFERAVHLDVDQLRNMVVSGLALPDAQWGRELVTQISLARGVAVSMANKYRLAGFTVVIDDFWDRNGLLEYQELLTSGAAHAVLLLPEQREAHRRNAARSAGTPAQGFIDAGIEDVYRQIAPRAAQLAADGWLVVDSTSKSPEQVVSEILAA